jgi:hypothetical protein
VYAEAGWRKLLGVSAPTPPRSCLSPCYRLVAQLGLHPCRQGSGGFSTSHAEQQIRAARLGAHFTLELEVGAIRHAKRRHRTKSLSAILRSSGRNMILLLRRWLVVRLTVLRARASRKGLGNVGTVFPGRVKVNGMWTTMAGASGQLAAQTAD